MQPYLKCCTKKTLSESISLKQQLSLYAKKCLQIIHKFSPYLLPAGNISNYLGEQLWLEITLGEHILLLTVLS